MEIKYNYMLIFITTVCQMMSGKYSGGKLYIQRIIYL